MAPLSLFLTFDVGIVLDIRNHNLISLTGKPYAYMAIKIVLVSILQTYFVEADGKLEEKGLTSDISVRFKDKKYPIRIKKRE